MFTTLVFSQKLSQTVRGTILDTDSKLPLIGATVKIIGTNPLIGTAADVKGKFRLENIPIGRITIQLSIWVMKQKIFPILRLTLVRRLS